VLQLPVVEVLDAALDLGRNFGTFGGHSDQDLHVHVDREAESANEDDLRYSDCSTADLNVNDTPKYLHTSHEQQYCSP